MIYSLIVGGNSVPSWSISKPSNDYEYPEKERCLCVLCCINWPFRCNHRKFGDSAPYYLAGVQRWFVRR